MILGHFSKLMHGKGGEKNGFRQKMKKLIRIPASLSFIHSGIALIDHPPYFFSQSVKNLINPIH